MNRAWVCLLIACTGILASPADVQPRDRTRASPAILRVLTYNIHHGEGLDGRFDLPRLAGIMTSEAPDLIALQEVDRGTKRANGVDQLTKLSRLTGMYGVFGKTMDYQGGAYGVAVLSRTPIGRVTNRRLPGSPEREPRTALTVDVETTERRSRVQFTTTHLDQGRDLMDQVAQASVLATGWGADTPGILAGDLNTRPEGSGGGSAIVSVHRLARICMVRVSGRVFKSPARMPAVSAPHAVARTLACATWSIRSRP